jgi:hypothetical protein
MRLVCLVPRLLRPDGEYRRGAEFEADEADAARLIRRRQARPVRVAAPAPAPAPAPPPEALTDGED